MTGFIVVIPARYASVRLPGKPLVEIAGEPLIRHVHDRAVESSASAVIVATDDERIARAVRGFGGNVCMTGTQHASGTERLAEVCEREAWDDDQRLVNLQGDEPLMPAALIDQCAALLDDRAVDVATLASPLASIEDFRNPNVVKALRNDSGDALYFSRAPIPHPREPENEDLALQTALHHHGIYGYRASVLKRLVAAPPSPLEICEQLEQLRALSLGLRIRVGVPRQRPGPGVDAPGDVDRVARLLNT